MTTNPTTTVLIPVDADSPARTQSAVAQAIRLGATQPVDVHLLSVQPPVSGHVAMFFGSDALHALQEQAGQEELQAAHSQLEAAGVHVADHVRVGRRAETIAHVADELHCATVLMGQGPAGTFSGRLFGSVAEQVRQLLRGDAQVIGA